MNNDVLPLSKYDCCSEVWGKTELYLFAWVQEVCLMVRGSSSKRNTFGGNDKRVPVKFSDTLHLLRFPLSLCSSAGIIQILIVLYSLVNKRKESAACRSI